MEGKRCSDFPIFLPSISPQPGIDCAHAGRFLTLRLGAALQRVFGRFIGVAGWKRRLPNTGWKHRAPGSATPWTGYAKQATTPL